MNCGAAHPILAFSFPDMHDLLVIAVLVLVLFGSKQLPFFAQRIGSKIDEIRKDSEAFERELHPKTLSDPEKQHAPHRCSFWFTARAVGKFPLQRAFPIVCILV